MSTFSPRSKTDGEYKINMIKNKISKKSERFYDIIVLIYICSHRSAFADTQIREAESVFHSAFSLS